MTDNNLYTIIPYQNKLLKFNEAKNARAYFKDHYIDLLNGESHKYEVESWLESLDFTVKTQNNDKRVIHLFYELGFIFENLSEDVLALDMLGIDIEYTQSSFYELPKDTHRINLSLLEAPHFNTYKNQFDKGYSELLEGNCYQFNLTGMYKYSFNHSLVAEDFIAGLWRKPDLRGAYGSATYSFHLGRLFLSNSPECLFQYANGLLITRPIKGTLKRESNNRDHVKKLWKKLVRDKKSEAELYMITDLLRNDLCRIDLPQAVVTKKKSMLLVPGLIHQFSEIKIALRSHVTFKEILQNIFPGGSITGAPKKRVMQILKDLEKRPRRFYCGSTIIFSKKNIIASINIRSSEIDFNNLELSYQAGGGITLMSNAKSEFEEMTYKHDSYIDILTL